MIKFPSKQHSDNAAAVKALWETMSHARRVEFAKRALDLVGDGDVELGSMLPASGAELRRLAGEG